MYLLTLLPFLATGLASPLALPDTVQACTSEQLHQGTCNAAPGPRKPLIACPNNVDSSTIPSPGLDLGSLPHHVSSVLVPNADFAAALQIPKIVFSDPKQSTVATADATQGTVPASVDIGNYNDPVGNLPFPTGTVSAAGNDKRGVDSVLDDTMSGYDEETLDHLLVLLERDEQRRSPSIDNSEQEPVARLVETSHTGLQSRSSSDFVPRASSREIFVGNINYRQIARQQGIIMIEADGPHPGETVCVITPQQVNNPLIDEDSIAYAWVGEHKFEVYLVEMFLKKNNPAIPQAYAYLFGGIWQQLTACGPALTRMQAILNSGLNLVGVSADINTLKLMLLQHGGVRDWANRRGWNSSILVARTHQYLLIVQNDYNTVAFLIAKVINSVSGFGDPPTTPSPGQDFITFAQRIYSVALDMAAGVATPLDVAGEYDIHALPSP